MILTVLRQSVSVIVRHARHSEESGAGILRAGICEGYAGRMAGLSSTGCTLHFHQP